MYLDSCGSLKSLASTLFKIETNLTKGVKIKLKNLSIGNPLLTSLLGKSLYNAFGISSANMSIKPAIIRFEGADSKGFGQVNPIDKGVGGYFPVSFAAEVV